METVEEFELLKGKTIEWAGVISNKTTGDAEFVMRFSDGTASTVCAWQKEGFPTEMSVEEFSK